MVVEVAAGVLSGSLALLADAGHMLTDAGGIVMVAAGLVVNLAAIWILRGSTGHSLNVEGTFRHVLADLMGSIGAVISGLLTLGFGRPIADPILSVLIGTLILLSS